jgi:hypothetical protein
MPQTDREYRWLNGLISHEMESWFAREPLPAISFPAIQSVTAPPSNENIKKNSFYVVSHAKAPRWILFQCPCGCGEVVTLSMQRVHRPRWYLRTSRNHRPNLQPSVWRDVGCMSHFCINDGRVFWCANTGRPP